MRIKLHHFRLPNEKSVLINVFHLCKTDFRTTLRQINMDFLLDFDNISIRG